MVKPHGHLEGVITASWGMVIQLEYSDLRFVELAKTIINEINCFSQSFPNCIVNQYPLHLTHPLVGYRSSEWRSRDESDMWLPVLDGPNCYSSSLHLGHRPLSRTGTCLLCCQIDLDLRHSDGARIMFRLVTFPPLTNKTHGFFIESRTENKTNPRFRTSRTETNASQHI